jgi:hypothetical protein
MRSEKIKVVSGTFIAVTAETEEDRQLLESELTGGQKAFLQGLREQVSRTMKKPLSKQLIQVTGKYIDIVPCEIKHED